jgi:hypothetical protein
LIVVCIVVAVAIAVAYVVVVIVVIAISPYFQTNEKVNLPLDSEQTERTRHRK